MCCNDRPRSVPDLHVCTLSVVLESVYLLAHVIVDVHRVDISMYCAHSHRPL